MFVRNIEIIIIFALLFLLASCTEKEVQSVEPPAEETKTEFMRTETESYSVVMTENVSLDKHAVFCTGSLLQNMPEAVLTDIETGAQPIESDDIPIWEYTTAMQSVYSDGSIEFDITSSIIDDEDINAILSVGASSIAFDDIPKRAVYSDGYMRLYGKNGTLLYEGFQPQPDMSEFCDSVAHYYERCQEECIAVTPPTTKSADLDVDSMMSLVRSRLAGAAVSDYKVEKVSESRMAIEYAQDRNYVRTVVSADLRRTYSTQTFTGGQLMSQTFFEYAPEEEINDYCVSIGDIRIMSPKKVTAQHLVYSEGSAPKIRTSVVGYKRNRTIINLN